jgi:hypothetical protein
MPILRLDTYRHDQIRRHLFTGDSEHVAFGYATWEERDAALRIGSVELMPPSSYAFQSDYHIELNHDAHAQIIKTAFDKEACLVEFHSHRSARPARFSFSDLKGFEEFVPHVRWRLARRPYAAIVCHETTYDGLIWIDSTPVQLNAIELGGTSRLTATGLTLQHLQEIYDRNTI